MDLNILITTIITATAALVAIIGGFLVSRVLTLSSERGGIERRFREISNDLFAKEDMLRRADLVLLNEDAEDFIKENYKKILLEDKNLEQIIGEDEYNSRTDEELRPFVDELIAIKEEVMALIEQAENDITHLEFNNFIDKIHVLKIPNRKYWYELVYETLKELFRKANSDNQLWSISFFTPSSQKPILPLYIAQAKNQFHKEKIDERNRLKDDVQVLKLQKIEQAKILGDYGKPKGLWGGLLVLIYACIVGIAYPGIYLPYPEHVYNDILTKWFLLGLFFSELIVLFLYLALEMYRLTKVNKAIGN